MTLQQFFTSLAIIAQISIAIILYTFVSELKQDNLHWKKVECAFENSIDSNYIISECVQNK